jgi:3-deoxy-manno-octulosonate cytidylyltransferase (CMP-KDO synthetase)
MSNTTRFIAIIPARFASTRFPGKPLAKLGDKCIIQHVYERVKTVFEQAYVATDDERIANEVERFGGKYIMTGSHHQSGTDRCYDALCQLGEKKYDVVVNIQGDESFISPQQLTTIKECFTDSDTSIATLVKPFPQGYRFEDIENPNSPKVVLSDDSFALYFSRSVIPYFRNIEKEDWSKHHTYYKHIGIYAYRSQVLKEITTLPQGELEKVESLEQLRWLQAGYKIKVGHTDIETIGIDTPEDLKRAIEFYNKEYHK